MGFYSYKFRLYPNEVQKKILSKQFGSNRFIYNYFLGKLNKDYEKAKEENTEYKQPSAFALINELPKLKFNYSWLKNVDAQSLQQSVDNVKTAYIRFFNKIGGYPQFKKKHGKNSFTVKQTGKLIDNTFSFSKCKNIKVVINRDVIGKIQSYTISKNKCNQYFVSVLVKKDLSNIYKTKPTTSIGIDLNLKDIMVTYDTNGNVERYNNPKTLYKQERSLKKLQRRMSHKMKGSNKNKARFKLAKKHQKVSNIRCDYLHKLSHKIVSENQAIYMEKLKVKNMVKCHNLAKSLSDASFGTLTEFIKYKSEIAGRTFGQVDTFFPSTKKCSSCGNLNHKLTLEDRYWTCGNCGRYHDRDVNAAKNILFQGSTVGGTGILSLWR